MKKNPHKRIDLIKEVLETFEKKLKTVSLDVEVLEQKFKSKWFPKKKEGDLEEAVDEPIEKSISPDGLDELRKLSKNG